MNSPLILKENAQCFLVQVPAGVPLHPRHRYGSEGFQSWFLRRSAYPAQSRDCQSLRVGKHELLLLPKSESGPQSERLRIESNSKAAVSVMHPLLPRFDWNPRAAVSDFEHQPTWLGAEDTNAYRCDQVLGPAFPRWIVTRLGEALLYQSEHSPNPSDVARLEASGNAMGLSAGYWKRHERAVQKKGKSDLCPELIWGNAEKIQRQIRESGVRYEVDFNEGYSYGLFLDQRENRYRLRHNQIEPGFPVFQERAGSRPQVLNTFAYTCGFSVCAALAGAEVVS